VVNVTKAKPKAKSIFIIFASVFESQRCFSVKTTLVQRCDVDRADQSTHAAQIATEYVLVKMQHIDLPHRSYPRLCSPILSQFFICP
jgi:hypothetical protein